MRARAADRRLGWRAYVVRPAGTLERLPQDEWLTIKSRDACREDLAGRPVRIVYAFILQRSGEPILLIALEGTVWRFDTTGRVDLGVPAFDSSRIGLDTPFAADVLADDQIQTGDRWQPDPAVRAMIERDIWPSGMPTFDPGGDSRPVDDCANLSRALAAVGSAAAARTMSRLVRELALTRQTVQQLMTALALDPETLRDVIAAEHEADTTKVH